ncbi:MAG: hypothetical protein ISR65_09530 [Bacteriovoracaceae bacterium]|nr:hypothetical protein [Bacteriovoracaceae bacterium]
MAFNLLNINNQSELDLLDWGYIVNRIIILAHFDETKEILNRPITSKNISQIEHEFDSIEFFFNELGCDASHIYQYIEQIPSDKAMFSNIERIKIGHFATIAELNFICLTLEAYKSLYKKFKNWVKASEFEIDQTAFNQINRNFIVKIRSFVSPNGTINYQRHPELSKIFTKIQEIEKELRHEINQIAKNPFYTDALQFSEHDIVNDHYVLAIRSDSYKSDHGSIMARSASGLTLFVTPLSIKIKSNKRQHLMAELEEILSRICSDFSKFLFNHYDQIKKAQTFLIEIDLLLAKGKYCHSLNLKRPRINSNFQTHLQDLFHPLIEDPVKNTISISSKQLGLIVSGPNTGGKTVAIKAITLSHLFLHYGLFLPISDGDITPCENIFYFGNDQQGLIDGLSSFASESRNYLSLLSELSGQNLIVIDEIFNSTSSEEASSLAIAFLEEIHKKSDSKIIISSHHQFFKTFMHSNNDYISCHVGFDRDGNRPTYKLNIGEPGSSMAFLIFEIIAGQLGIKSPIPERAKEMFDKKHLSYEALLQELTFKKSKLDRELNKNRQLNTQLKNQKKSMEGLIHLEKQKILNEFQEKIDKTFSEAKKILNDVKSQKLGNQKTFFSKVKNVQSQLNQLGDDSSKLQADNPLYDKYTSVPSSEDIKVNSNYFSTILGRVVRVTSFNQRKNEVSVSDKKINLRCKIDTLRLISSNQQSVSSSKVTINLDKPDVSPLEINCIGMRLEQFQSTVEKSLVDLDMGNIPFLSIIHGHGDGILKSWLRQKLSKSDNYKWEADEYNDGCTKIYCK